MTGIFFIGDAVTEGALGGAGPWGQNVAECSARGRVCREFALRGKRPRVRGVWRARPRSNHATYAAAPYQAGRPLPLPRAAVGSVRTQTKMATEVIHKTPITMLKGENTA